MKNNQNIYPFLSEENNNLNKIETLAKFRVPYYVGPLVAASSMKDGSNSENHWVTFKDSKEEVTPWNFSEVIDTDKSAADFIHRLTGTDTYLFGEETMPKNSVTYQTFNVLQELNNIRVNGNRLDVSDKQYIFNNIFRQKNSVSISEVEETLSSKIGEVVKITGFADVSGKRFNSNLSTLYYLRGILGDDFVDDHKNSEILDKIIELQTVFEDKKVLGRQLEKLVKDGLPEEKISKLSEKHFTGWGSLSAKLLLESKLKTDKRDIGSINVLTALYETNNNFQELLQNKETGLNNWIEEQNSNEEKGKNAYDLIDEMAGAKNIKRGITQSFRVMDDIVKAIGYEPENVYLEFARETQKSNISNSRLNYLNNLYQNSSLKESFVEIIKKLNEETKQTVQDDRLYLYYIQQGKDLYTGEPIDIDNLSNYDIDHIIPQAYIKDNSLDNRVLVSSAINRIKTSDMDFLYKNSEKLKSIWKSLKEQGFISHKKYRNLTADKKYIEDNQDRFIQRSLVETRQIIKNVVTFIVEHFDETKAVAVRSELTSDMRRYIGIKKNRDINDYHHAHDALLVATVGKYIDKRGIFGKDRHDIDGNAYSVYRDDFIKNAQNKKKINDSSEYEKRLNPFGFVVGSMKSTNSAVKTNKETGELAWSNNDFDYLVDVISNTKNMLITRRTKEQTGELYNETRYEAGNVKSKEPFNKKKDLILYGGFGSIKPAYAALIKSKNKYRFVNIPRMWAAQVKKSKNYLLDKIRDEYLDAELVIPRILYGQILIKDGALLTISSATELHNFKQLYLNREDYEFINKLMTAKNETEVDGYMNKNRKEVKNNPYEFGINLILNHAKDNFPMHLKMIEKLSEKISNIDNISFDEKKQTLERILQALHANPTSADLSKINSISNFGRLVYPSGVVLDEDDILITRSVSGIFENTIKIKDLKK